MSNNNSNNKNKHSISTGAAALISVLAVPVELLLFNIVKDTDGNKLRIQALFF